MGFYMQIFLFFILLLINQLSAVDFNYDQNPSKKILETVAHMHYFNPAQLNSGSLITYVDSDLSEFIIVPEGANQGWTLGLWDFSGKTNPHYHNLVNQILVPLEGQISVRIDDQEINLLAGQSAIYAAGPVHSLKAGDKGVRFILIDIPGFDYPSDRSFDKSLPDLQNRIEAAEIASSFFVDQTVQLPSKDSLFPLDPKYYQTKTENENYISYSVISPDSVEGKWSLGFIDIKNTSLKPLDLTGTERFVVLNGTIQIQVNDSEYFLSPGQSVRVSIDTDFNVCSKGKESARLLRIIHY